MKWLAPLLVALALLLSVPATAAASGSMRWPALTRIADRVTGQRVDLSCDSLAEQAGADPYANHVSPDDWAPGRIWGYTILGGSDEQGTDVTLSPLACAGLLTALLHPRLDEGYALDGKNQEYNVFIEGFAVHAFTHELGHVIYGFVPDDQWSQDAPFPLSETAAECFAMRNDARVARMLGISREWSTWMHQAGMAYHSWLADYYKGPCPASASGLSQARLQPLVLR